MCKLFESFSSKLLGKEGMYVKFVCVWEGGVSFIKEIEDI